MSAYRLLKGNIYELKRCYYRLLRIDGHHQLCYDNWQIKFLHIIILPPHQRGFRFDATF